VGLRGTGHTIRRVTVENVAGLGYEGFPIFIGSNGLDSSNNLIENCLIRGWKGGTGGSITLANNLNNGHPPKTWTSGIIRNNRVEGTHIGYGGWGMRGVVFEHNVAEGCAFGSNIDSLGNRGVRFTGNQFLNCTSYGMVFAQCHKFQIAGNTITLAGGGPYLFFLNDVSDFFVTDNTFRSASGHPEMAGLRDAATATGKFVFSGNTSTPPAPVNLPASLLAPQ
jgi:hypothetical protein